MVQLYRCPMSECNDPGSTDPDSRCPVCGMRREAVGESATAGESSATLYRCTMPECNDPGSTDPDSRCPVCGMRREAVAGGSGSDSSGVPSIHLDERARRLAELATEEVVSRSLMRRVRATGKVDFDEQRYVAVSARIEGTVDSLTANYTGMTVSEGQELMQIYSLDLLAAQNELLRLVWGFGRIAGRGRNRSVDQDLVTSRHRLELMGMSAPEIDRMLEVDHEDPYLRVKSPITGSVIRKDVLLGDYVTAGDPLFEIADLSRVWLLVDLYEDDLPWVTLGQEVEATARSLPGERFTGRIAFVDPVVDERKRTIQVRVELDNSSGRLKPGMFANASIAAKLVGDGDGAKQLSVPREAVLKTGERTIVYLESVPGTYHGADVALGPLGEGHSGRQFYPVLSGLRGGEKVVTRGAFVIDSQMQIAGKPSLFTARGLDRTPEQTATGDSGSAADHVTPLPTAAAATHTDRHGDARPTMVGQHQRRQQPAPHPDEAPPTEQVLCPVMGNPIDRTVFVDYGGERIYFCCHLCTPKFLDDPEEFLPELPLAMQQRIADYLSEIRVELGDG